MVIVIYLDFLSTKQALWLVDSWSHAPDRILMYSDFVQLLSVPQLQQHMIV